MDEPTGLKASLNGANGATPNGNHKMHPDRRRHQTPPSVLARLFNTTARLFTWYAILTILFRCPSSLESCDESTPRLCRPYLQVRALVAPGLEPLYDAYAAPYVEVAQTYYSAVDRSVLTPARLVTAEYVTPKVAYASNYAEALWQKNAGPQLAAYRALAEARYQEQVAPHVASASKAVAPYLEIARASALRTYDELLLPAYELSEPYAVRAYHAAADFTTNAVVPSTAWTLNKTYVFLHDTIWPHLRALYVESVEPQLLRIGQRLGRYKTTGGSHTAHTAWSTSTGPTTSSFKKPASPVSSPSTTSSATTSPSIAASSIAEQSIPSQAPHSSDDNTRGTPPADMPGSESPSAPGVRAKLLNPVSAPPATESESDSRRTARETVAEDLEQWQAKFTKAADEGAEEIQKHIEDVTSKKLTELRSKGNSMITSLESVIEAAMTTLRKSIVSIAAAADGDVEASQEQITLAIRRAGQTIKTKAEEVRNWREKFDDEVEAAVTKAAEEHFMILGSMRDLALQKIGMKWAWMDGVTYKDWAKYHALRDRLDEWMTDLKQFIVQHPALLETQEATADLEDVVVDMAGSAAKELARIKQVAVWKVIARDASDDFDSDTTKLAAEAAEEAAKAAKRAAEELPVPSEKQEEDRSDHTVVNDDVAASASALEADETPEPVKSSAAAAEYLGAATDSDPSIAVEEQQAEIKRNVATEPEIEADGVPESDLGADVPPASSSSVDSDSADEDEPTVAADAEADATSFSEDPIAPESAVPEISTSVSEAIPTDVSAEGDNSNSGTTNEDLEVSSGDEVQDAEDDASAPGSANTATAPVDDKASSQTARVQETVVSELGADDKVQASENLEAMGQLAEDMMQGNEPAVSSSIVEHINAAYSTVSAEASDSTEKASLSSSAAETPNYGKDEL